MEGRLVLKNCCLWGEAGRPRLSQAVVVEGERISQVAANESVPVRPGDWEVACGGRLLARGKVNGHLHLVSRQLAAVEGLERRLVESHLTAAEVEALSAHGMAQALLAGFTLVVEQLSCPRQVNLALASEARTARRLGLRTVLSHATESRTDRPAAFAQLDENAAFADEAVKDAWVFPALGLGAAEHREEALRDRAVREQKKGRSLLVVCSAEEDPAVWESGALVGSEPLGRKVTWFPPLSDTRGSGFELLVGDFPRVLQNAEGAFRRLTEEGPAALRAMLWGDGSVGIEAGALADLVVHDIVLSDVDTMSGRMWMEIEQSKVAWTIVNGRVAVREGELLGADALELAREAAKVKSLLWRRAGAGARGG
jgi:5-methylthioadenosine/S-adenosylhomocysteine deaminase